MRIPPAEPNRSLLAFLYRKRRCVELWLGSVRHNGFRWTRRNLKVFGGLK